MSMPSNYEWMKTRFSEVMDAHQEFGKSLQSAGPIDAKTAQLIQLAAAASNRSEGSVHSHTRRALAAGATADEIYHALILLASTIGFPASAASIAWARETIEKD